jgi:ATP-dependent DNA helicase RecG
MNNAAIIENLLSGKKSKNLLLMQTLDAPILGRTLCAYLNEKGGDIIIGAASKAIIPGIEKGSEKLIENEVLNRIIPAAPVSINSIEYNGVNVLLLSAWPGSKKPYNYQGKIYVTEANEVQPASSRKLKELNSIRKESEFHWERQSVLGATLDDLDYQEIRRTIKEYQKSQPNTKSISEEEFLTRLGLLFGGNLTNAAIILFANNPNKYLPQCKVRSTVYSASKGSKVILFDKVYDGNLFRNINAIWDLFDTQLKRASTITGLKRKSDPLPIVALREGLLNALIHRDYSKISSTVNISVYPDKLIISNTGKLPDEITVKDLKKDHDSILRNPDIANVLFIREYIEMIGTGTLRMVADCKENNYPVPEWKTKENRLELTLNNVGHRIKNDGVSDGISDGVNRIVSDGISDGVIDGVSDGVRKELIKIVTLLKDQEGINTDDIVEHISKSKPTVERYLKTARDLKIVTFTGASKTGGYYLTEKVKKHITNKK